MSPVPRYALCAVVASVALLGCSGRERVAPGGAVVLRELLPPPSVHAGWSVVEGPVEFGPDTLFEVLDGGAERYLSHGFRALLRVRWGREVPALGGVTLDIFDMGGELGAFGIYSTVRPDVAEFFDWGSEGYRAGPMVAAWKGRLFVHAEADEAGQEEVALMERAVARVCAALPGAASRPAILARLPAEGLVARSERYTPRALLGHECLPGGVLARYRLAGGMAEVFFSEVGTEASAAKALGLLREHYARWGEVLPGTPAAGTRGFRFTAPGLGPGAVTGAGRYVAGVHGESAREESERLLTRLVANLVGASER